ncbi:NHL repeat-containing protein [Mucilaginibacter auburnensis]|uniref:NHL repeat-containing protein n=1 Tax=Mucilaginibacter auburnensis TaxID=1457233 RepID=A0A2H9VQ94_9SPHI|nr:hypothetical protein [Mucilaginibacter auburnensis]PJJ80482.1 NHL repeat-containing protein [Mucilaginibacter auburnensis]
MKRYLSGSFVAFLIVALFISSCKKSDPPPVEINIGTAPIITNVTPSSVRIGGELLSIGDAMTSNGICYSATNATPSVADSKVAVDSLAFVFGGKLNGLTPATKYYARAYGINKAGTFYGDVITFTTPSSTFKLDVDVSTIAGSSTFGFVDGTGANARFDGPQDIAFNSKTGLLQLTDVVNNAVRTVSATGDVLTLTNSGRGYVNGNLADARFYGSRGMVVDAAGNTYVADAGNHAIRKITAAGVVTTFAGSPTGSAGYADSTDPLKALFNVPRSLALDANGNLYVADFGNNRIRKITSAGVVTTLAGDGIARYVNSVAANSNVASFNGPASVAIDAQGSLIVADQGNKALRKVNVTTGIVTTIGGGPNYPNQIGTPVAITIDPQSNIYIVDKGGQILQLRASSKSLYVLAGKANTTGYANGTGATSLFSSPTGIAVDAAGNAYVADFANNVVRKLAITVTP